MRTFRYFLLWILIPLNLGPSATAQSRPPHFEVFAEGGASVLNSGSGLNPEPCAGPCTPTNCGCVSTLANSSTSAGRVVAGARWRFTPHDALEASYSFSPNHMSFQSGTVTQSSKYNRVDLVCFNFVRYLWTKTPIQPFATAGIGLNRFSGPPALGPLPGYLSTFWFNNDNGYQLAWNFGGGTDVVLQRHFALRLELRDYVTGQPSFISGLSHNIVPSAGIVFRFR